MQKESKVGRHARMMLLASATLSALVPQVTLAQAVVPPPSTNDGQDTDTGVADIVVTAQRRAESLQKVPLSVVAITGEELRNADLRDITRLEQAVPGLRIGRSGPAARPALRGVYTEATGANSDPRIGFYIDEVYQSRLQQATAAFVDLERVEVQKGPQGTLFGRNSLGGNIALTTASPKDKFDFGGAVIIGNYDRRKIEGFINVPIAAGLAARVAVSADKHDGYLKSVVTDAADLQDLDYGFVRGSLRYAPEGLDGRLEVLLRASYYRERDKGSSSLNAKNLGALVDRSLIRRPGESLTYNGITYPFPFGYNGGNYATGTLVPFSTVFRDGIADVDGADIGIPIPGIYQSIYDFPSRQKIDTENYSATINFDLSSSVRLRSITGYTDFSASNINDGDGGPIPFSAYYVITQAQTFTQELQVQSADAASPIQYTLGAFYMHDKNNDAGATIYPDHSYSTATAAAQGLPVLYASGSNCGFSYSPLGAPFSCALNNFNSADAAGPSAALTKSYAAYGQVSYRFGDQLTLTAGARYTVDDKIYKSLAQVTPISTFVGTYVAAQNAAAVAAGRAAPFPNPAGYHAVFPFNEDRATFANFECGGVTPGDFAPAGSNTVVGTVPNYFVTRCGERKFKYLTYRLAADYQLTPENLLYISYSTGNHSGGFGSPFTTATVPQGEFGTFDTEGVRAVELGSKNQFFDRRLQVNVALFYNKYTDLQVQGLQFIPATGTNIATITNLGDSEAPGAEILVVARPTPRLTVRAALNYLHARNSVEPLGIFSSGLCAISTGAGSPCAVNAVATRAGLGSGFFPNPLTNPELFVPVTNATGAVVDYLSLFFAEKTRVQNVPDWSGNVSLAYEIPFGRSGTLTPEVDVLYSGNYLLSASIPNFQQSAYAKADLRLTYRSGNGRYSLQAFVQNVTDKATLGRVTTSSLSAQGTYSDPRTFGARLSFNY